MAMRWCRKVKLSIRIDNLNAPGPTSPISFVDAGGVSLARRRPIRPEREPRAHIKMEQKTKTEQEQLTLDEYRKHRGA